MATFVPGNGGGLRPYGEAVIRPFPMAGTQTFKQSHPPVSGSPAIVADSTKPTETHKPAEPLAMGPKLAALKPKARLFVQHICGDSRLDAARVQEARLPRSATRSARVVEVSSSRRRRA